MKSEDIFHRGYLTTEPMKDWKPINTSGITVLLVKTCFDLFQNSGKLHFATKTTFLIRQKRKAVGSITSRWSGKKALNHPPRELKGASKTGLRRVAENEPREDVELGGRLSLICMVIRLRFV